MRTAKVYLTPKNEHHKIEVRENGIVIFRGRDTGDLIAAGWNISDEVKTDAYAQYRKATRKD